MVREYGRAVAGVGGRLGYFPEEVIHHLVGREAKSAKVDCNSSNQKPEAGLVPATYILLV